MLLSALQHSMTGVLCQILVRQHTLRLLMLHVRLHVLR